MVRRKPSLPAGHGELLARPAVEDWAAIVEANRRAMSGWTFDVGGVGAEELRALARAESLERARDFSARLGVPVAHPGPADGAIVATGHQPELYHPGVWVKDFLLQRLAEDAGATAIDVVVDSDGFDTLGVTAPCLVPEVRQCRQTLAVGSAGGWFASASVPAQSDLDLFVHAASGMLETLPAPAIGHHFATFAGHLGTAAEDAQNLAELVTFARRRYEASAGTDYLELPVTSLARSRAFAAFVVQLATDALRFATVYNAALGQFRAESGTRSKAQPFPDLAISESTVELPLWALTPDGRKSVHVDVSGPSPVLMAEGDALCTFGACDAENTAGIAACGCVLAPKALALTMFMRMFVCDLFIHGVGGGRYDRVTDDVIREYFGVEPPRFVIASLTMYLPLGAHVVTDDEISAARERLNRLEHNPDALLAEVDFESAGERERAAELSQRKRRLVDGIGRPDADKKTLGAQIREVNAELSALLEPLREELAAELASLEAQHSEFEVLTDRSYPFCFWAPEEVADKVR